MEKSPNGWILHHDNAPAHKALSIEPVSGPKSITEKEHPHYSPHLVLIDFWLFPKIQCALKGRIF
jgi:hypothetical protein